MATRSDSQLALIDVPMFAGGPARLPRAKAARAAAPPSLPLPFDEEAARRRRDAEVEARVAERLRDVLRPRAPAPPPPPEREPQASDAEEMHTPSEGPSAEWVFAWRRKPSDRDRADAVAALGTALGGPAPRRATACEVREDGDRLAARVDGQVLRVSVSGPTAKSRWRSAVAQVAERLGLVEPE